MSLERISQKEAEEGITFLKNGLPEEAVPIQGEQFSGYYSFTRQMGEKKVKLIYESSGKSFIFRNAFYLE